MKCQICENEIQGEVFSLSDLSPSPKVLKVCQKCAESESITIYHAGIEMTVHRDDYIRCNKGRLQYAVEEVYSNLEEYGWHYRSGTIRDHHG